ncbi:TetR/AcrR family transcriptional regulator [Rhodococcus sp. ARC_M6]|uniref:TetR/AcrR family transcriptional regulator n=1 Tax=Rhodococcus sp. ARC_M6 TaxID=2928852 RepID=UPI001FB4F531|nr:TetR/AcrR family transcriptional regulator [Rhodococcus sp. ARC_M6]MCJ0903283.1 TetR/AcrR family transcriptional regulator [Rhodococcus sp. ARC_M6]
MTDTTTSSARERVIARLVAAARPLFAEKGASDVSLREVATAAGVNYGLIHHYIGTKDDLLKIVLQRASAEWADYFVDAPTVDDAVSTIMRPKSSEYARMVAQSILAGGAPETLLGQSPALAALSQRIAGDIDRPSTSGDDPRILVAAITGMALGWGVFGRFVQEIAGLGDQDEDDVTEAVYALLRRAIDQQ